MTWVCKRCGTDNQDEQEKCTDCHKWRYKNSRAKQAPKVDGSRMTLNISLNTHEQEMLFKAMDFLNQEDKGRALKQLAVVGYNVLHGTLGADLVRYLSAGERNRPLDIPWRKDRV